MGIAVDASTPAVVASTSQTQTTAAFSPPAASLLVACMSWEASGGITTSMSNSGTALTWTLRGRRNQADAGAQSGDVSIYTAPNVSAQTGITVSGMSSLSSDGGGLKVFVVTGADLVNPVGASGEGSSTTQNITPAAYTSTVASSRGFGIGQDWQATGSPTSTDVGFPYHIATSISGIAVHKAADTAIAGTGVTLNFNAGGASPQWNWVAVEILPNVPFAAPRPLTPGMSAPIFRGAYY